MHSYFHIIKRVVVTGPESSGKTTLAQQLAHELKAIYVPEYARTYLETHGMDYSLSDIISIGVGQLAIAEAAADSSSDHEYLIIDTWMLELKVWCQYVYGVVPDVIEQMYAEHRPDLFLLCTPDLKWEPDPVRENPTDRHVLYALYEKAVTESGIPYCVVSGTGAARTQEALRFVREEVGRMGE